MRVGRAAPRRGRRCRPARARRRRRRRGRGTRGRRAAAHGRPPPSPRGARRGGRARCTRSCGACAPSWAGTRARRRAPPRPSRGPSPPSVRACSSSGFQGCSDAVAPCSGARANASARARSAGPSPRPSASARSPSPSDSRAHARAASGATPRDCSRCASCSLERRVEADGLAARHDRRQHLGEPVGEQQQHDVRRRLLERLEQRVGRLVVHRVGALEHEHAVARLERGARRGRHDGLVDVAAQHLVRAARRDPAQVGMRAVLDAGADAVRVGGAAGQQRGREGARRGALAAARPDRAAGRRARAGRRRRARRRGRRRRAGGLRGRAWPPGAS